MTVNLAINGFGRIGRCILRAWIESGRDDVTITAINDLAPVATNAHRRALYASLVVVICLSCSARHRVRCTAA